jgi:hypothetical protein
MLECSVNRTAIALIEKCTVIGRVRLGKMSGFLNVKN